MRKYCLSSARPAWSSTFTMTPSPLSRGRCSSGLGVTRTPMCWRRPMFLQAKFDQAAVHLHKSIQANPNQTASYYYLGLIAEEKGQSGEAIARLADVVKRDPEYSPAYEALGRMLVKEQKYPEAEEALRKAV